MTATATEERPREDARATSAREAGRARVPGGVTGAVLCGGASRRMGRDKALLELGGVRLVERAVRCLAPLADRVVLACGPTPRYAELGVERVLDRAPGGGPLFGLEAALVAADTEWVAVLACDMPRVTPAVFEALFAHARERDLDACLVAGPRGREPLCAVVRRTCRAAVSAAVAAGERRVVAFHGRCLDGLRSDDVAAKSRPLVVGELSLADAEELCVNVNSPAELERERARAAGAAPRTRGGDAEGRNRGGDAEGRSRGGGAP